MQHTLFGTIILILTTWTLTAHCSNSQYNSYIVHDQDTLMDISFIHYGTHHCWSIIQKINPQIEDPDIIEEGISITIPQRSQCQHPNASIQHDNQKSTATKKLAKKKRLSPHLKGYLKQKNIDHFVLYDKNRDPKRALPQLKGAKNKEHGKKAAYSDPTLRRKRIAQKKKLERERQQAIKLEQARLEKIAKEEAIAFLKEELRQDEMAEKEEIARQREIKRKQQLVKKRELAILKKAQKLKEQAKKRELARIKKEKEQKELAKKKEIAQLEKIRKEKERLAKALLDIELKKEKAKKEEIIRQAEIARKQEEDRQRELAHQKKIAREKEQVRQKLIARQKEKERKKELAQQNKITKQKERARKKELAQLEKIRKEKEKIAKQEEKAATALKKKTERQELAKKKEIEHQKVVLKNLNEITRKRRNQVRDQYINAIVEPIKETKKSTKNTKAKRKYTIQLAAYPTLGEAKKLHTKLRVAGINARIEKPTIIAKKKWFRVRTGYFAKRKEAEKFLSQPKIKLFIKKYYIQKL